MKIVEDTLKVKGKYSMKRLLTFTSVWSAIMYAYTPIIFKEFIVNEFVFLGFLGIGGFSVFRTQKVNENIEKPHEEDYETT